MPNYSTYSFGSGNNISFTKEDLSLGSEYFITPDSQLSSKLGSEVFKGEFSVDDGLVAFDTSPVLTPQPGVNNTGSAASSASAPATPPSSPSTRPYIWKPS